MKDINDVMPKILGMKWGAIMNQYPTNAKLKQINKTLPHDGKWHSIFEGPGSTVIDGKEIRQRTVQSMT